jgi:ABC-2 type transport system permease protein
MILPAAINSLAAFAHPAPSRVDMVLAARAASTDADRARDASLARYAQEHGGGKPAGGAGAQEATLRRLATQEAAFQRVEAIVAEHDAQLARQRDMAERRGYLSPAYLTYRRSPTSPARGKRYRAFLDRIRAFHVDWREFFLSRARRAHR